MHYDRRIEQDLIALTQHIAVDASLAVVLAGRKFERDPQDVAKAALLALANVAAQLRRKFDLPVEVWAEANRIANDPRSLTNTTPVMPAIRAHMAAASAAASSTTTH